MTQLGTDEQVPQSGTYIARIQWQYMFNFSEQLMSLLKKKTAWVLLPEFTTLFPYCIQKGPEGDKSSSRKESFRGFRVGKPTHHYSAHTHHVQHGVWVQALDSNPLCYLPAMWPWTSYWTSLTSFPTFKMCNNQQYLPHQSVMKIKYCPVR